MRITASSNYKQKVGKFEITLYYLHFKNKENTAILAFKKSKNRSSSTQNMDAAQIKVKCAPAGGNKLMKMGLQISIPNHLAFLFQKLSIITFKIFGRRATYARPTFSMAPQRPINPSPLVWVGGGERARAREGTTKITAAPAKLLKSKQNK